MPNFNARKILLGVCGGIAAYKTPFLIREFKQLGAEVRIILTKAAAQFVSTITLQAISSHDVRSSLFDQNAEAAMSHIELARWGDYLLIAPITANCMAKMAMGMADDLITTVYLANEKPVFLCPAMNRAMWEHPATQANYQILSERGAIFIGPEYGWQACGVYGPGRLSEFTAIINTLLLSKIHKLLAGQKVLITAGPTQEAIDPVRFIGNKSSGKMGYALATAAVIAGAEVTLISGPTALTPPPLAKTFYVQSALELQAAVHEHLQKDMIFIGAAAVADYRLANPNATKIKKENTGNLVLTLTENPDIIATVVTSNKAKFVVGFAAETNDLAENAIYKLRKKNLNMIIANQVGENKGFDADYNTVTVFTPTTQIDLPLSHKTLLAGELIAIIATNIQN